MERREFLRMTGVAGLAVAGAAGWYSIEDGGVLRADDAAYAAWRDWEKDGGPAALKLVRAAVLASSPHNTQPWRFRVGGDFVEMYLEAKRSVAGLDPYLREAHIGLGCGLENLLLAAEFQGLSTKVEIATGPLDGPEVGGALRLVARVDLGPGVSRESELYRAIPRRHTNRSVYDRSRELPTRFVEELRKVSEVGDEAKLFLFEDTARQDCLSRISSYANVELYSDPAVEAGSDAWVRWRAAEAMRLKDGLTVESFGLPPAETIAVGLLPHWLLKEASAPQQRTAMYERQMRSARLIGVIAVRDRFDRGQSVQAGRMWQRAHLLATARGVGARPCNEAIELIDYERRLGKPAGCQQALCRLMGDDGWQPTFLFLMGQPTLPAHGSPRRTAEDVLV